jgi:hypothetical protein
MSRLLEKMAKAASAAKRLSDKIEARADPIIGCETLTERKSNKAFSPHAATPS